MRLLTINCGSSSVKVDVINLEDAVREGEVPERAARAGVTAIGRNATATIEMPGRPAEQLRIDGHDYGAATLAVLGLLRQAGLLQDVGAAGHRVVHGGHSLTSPVLIDDEILAKIEEVSDLAPLHNGPALQAIRASMEVLDLPMAATFDTGFFAGLPAVASTYAIPRDLSERLSIRRFGFHGLAHRWMSESFRRQSGNEDARLVTLQLGAGCSAAAVRAGKPIDTSMGFTPLEGLVMATRSGDLDPALPHYLGERAGMAAEAIDEMLNHDSGLLGLSGISGDVREVLAAEAQGSEAAKLALDVYCYRIVKYMGAYAAALGGLDGLVFGGGVGENSAAIRARVCGQLRWLGLELDEAANADPQAHSGTISTPDSKIRCQVEPVDEAMLIARDTLACLDRLRNSGGEDAGARPYR